jgi:hypothetical protein
MLGLIIISLSWTPKFRYDDRQWFLEVNFLSQQNLHLYRSDMSSKLKIRHVSPTWLRGKACCSKGMRKTISC